MSKIRKTSTKDNAQDVMGVKRAGFINEFLWLCAGANRKLLRQCPTEYAKYAGIGGTILFTALMATLSGGYAFYTVFKNELTACFFGIFWGLLIFNLDRFMVNTMYSDGKHTISKDEFLGGLPRIVLAIFLGVVISVPVEMRIFEDKIQSQLLIDQGVVSNDVRSANELLYKERARIENLINENNKRLAVLQSGISEGYATRIASKEKELKEANDEYYNEVYGGGVTKKPGHGIVAKQRMEDVNRIKNELAILKEDAKKEKASNEEEIAQQKKYVQLDSEELRRQLKNINEQITQKEKEGANATNALTGFAARLRALSEITDYTKNPTLFFARLMIMLLFITIEVIPTLFKMMMTAGPYDNLLRAEMHRVKVLSDKRISDVNDDVNTSVMVSTEINKKRMIAEIKANDDLMSEIASAQSELLKIAIEEWKKQELEKLKENPGAYISLEKK